MSKPKILVTNATGKTGFATVKQLLEAEYPVRAFVRRRNHRAINLERWGAELFIGDLSNTADLNLAMQRVQRAYLCIPPAPNVLFNSIPFAVAAADAQLEVIVMMSQWLAHPQHPASANFLKIILTPASDLDKYERSLEFPVIERAVYAPDFSPWMNSHSISKIALGN